jgi:hypothetical protein
MERPWSAGGPAKRPQESASARLAIGSAFDSGTAHTPIHPAKGLTHMRSRSVRSAVLSTASAAGMAIGGLAFPIVFPHVPAWIGKDMMWLAAALVALTLILWLWDLGPPVPPGGMNQTTLGPASHNFGTVGTVTINPPPAATQERKSPYGTPMSSERRSTVHRKLTGLRPDMLFNALIVRVVKSHGGAPADEADKPAFWRKVSLDIQDEISQRDARVWGRLDDQAIRLLSPDLMAKGKLDLRKGTLSGPVGDSVHPIEYSDLKFSKFEIDEIWPPA